MECRGEEQNFCEGPLNESVAMAMAIIIFPNRFEGTHRDEKFVKDRNALSSVECFTVKKRCQELHSLVSPRRVGVCLIRRSRRVSQPTLEFTSESSRSARCGKAKVGKYHRNI